MIQKLTSATLRSKTLFWLVLAIFVLYAASIAISSGTTLAFDESYHFALINHYSHNISPIITSQPAELSMMGDATRLGSYLSHYVLSFPLRIVQLLGGDTQLQFVTLRLINIAFVAAALIVFRRFVTNVTNSAGVATIAVILFCALPVTSYLAANINYDNALLLCFALLLLAAQRVIASGIKNELSYGQLLVFASIAMIGCLVKFTFLPIAGAITLFIFGFALTRRVKPRFAKSELKTVKARVRYTFIIALSLLASGLFAERYGGNVAAYGSLQPDCVAVQDLKTCLNYGPWARNYTLAQGAKSDTTFEGRSVQGYVAHLWAPMMTNGLGYTGVANGVSKSTFYVLAILMLITIIGVSAVLFLGNRIYMMVIFASMIYFVALLQRNYSEFMQFHEAVAVQGRYALPFMVPFFAIAVIGIGAYVRQLRKLPVKLSMIIVHLRDVEPDVAYELSRSYWAARLEQRRLARD